MKTDELETKVSELLELVTAKGIRELYEDAKSVLDCDKLRAPEKAIGNYLREIESALFSVTVSIAKLDADISQYQDDEGHISRASQIELVKDYFKLDLSEEQLKFWKDIKLHQLAHRSGLKPNRKISEAFIEEVWLPYSAILLGVAECINKAFISYYDRLEQIAKNPSKDNCKAVLQQIPNNPHLRDHFFESIEDFSAWLPMLRSKGIFEDVPLEYVTEDGYLVTQPWPPLDFLLRIVSNTADEKILSDVAEIAASIPGTENLRVNDDLLILAGKLPVDLSVKHLMPRVQKALDSKGLYTMGEKVSGLLVQLHEGDFSKELVDVAEKVIADKKLNPFFEERYIRNNMNFYYYNGLLTLICGFNNFDIFRVLYQRVLEGLAFEHKDNQSEKYRTLHWKHAFNDEIEKDELTLMYVSKLSLLADKLIVSGSAELDEIITLLLEGNHEKDWHIIKALILGLLDKHESTQYAELKSDLEKELSDYEQNRKDRKEPEVRSVIHISPYSDEEMSRLSAEEALERLQTYDGPEDDHWNEKPSKRGLLESVERQLKQRPDEFVGCLDVFFKVRTEDFTSLLYALAQSEFEVSDDFKESYLALINDFIENRYDDATERNKRNFSSSVTRVFRKIFNSSENYMPLNGIAFTALDKIIKDPLVGSAILSSSREDKFHEMANHAVNTPSVEAFDCLVDCYLTPNTKWKDIRARDDIGAFQDYISSVVDADDSAPFRFRVGENINSFVGTDKDWFVKDLKKIVLNKDRDEPWEAFVAGMMAQRIICNDFLDDVYRDAVRYVSTEEYLTNHSARDEFSIENGIARHISFYYCQLDKQACTENSLTNYIFIHGSLPLRHAFFVEAKKQFKKSDGVEKTFARMKELIDWRYAKLRKSNFPPDKVMELSGFFSLFPIVVQHDPEWSLEHLCEFMDLLETNGEPFHPDIIIDALIEQAESFPLLAAKCLRSWVKGMKNRWHDFNDIKKLIESLYEHGDEETKDILKEVVSRLSSKGICRELVGLFKQK
ncbi:MAG: hypothetical protein N0C88_08605 [Candidatus Thiodiazotropha lotti]|uniref:Uncharacterized protein n=1 Tax=Candidatus Thiodiazotropha lotti TaxID=2792787 RepID=A0A9E4MYV8_9GAMM|nr:hypothetical protein [Candidatus Thiodiazotropha lotti]MCW4203369.1 hypothetical protein [Candidatus Thiodiazotropha lotti]